MSRAPWLKFYPADWRSDTALRACSPAARGIWLDLIGVMHEAEPYGHLLINGAPPSIKTLSGLLNVHHKTLIACLKELSDKGVYSLNDRGVMFSRRMVRDHEKALQDQANGRRGGNPKVLAKQPEGVNPRVNGEDKAQKPEARSQNIIAVADAATIKARIEEAKARAGAAVNLTCGFVHHYADLRRMLDAGCDWDQDVIPAIDAVAAGIIARNKTKIQSWAHDGIQEAAVRNRDRRLAGLPEPQAPQQRAASGGRAPSAATVINRMIAEGKLA